MWLNVIKWLACLISDSLIYDSLSKTEDGYPEIDQMRERVKGLLTAMMSIQDMSLSIRIINLQSTIHFFEYRFNIG